MRRDITSTLLLVALASIGLEARCETPAAITLSELVFERAPFASSHASTIVETPTGELVAAWFGGTRERHADVSIWTARRDQRGWSAPVEVAELLAQADEALHAELTSELGRRPGASLPA